MDVLHIKNLKKKDFSTEFSIHTLPRCERMDTDYAKLWKEKEYILLCFLIRLFSLFQMLTIQEKNVWDLNPGHLPVFILSMF